MSSSAVARFRPEYRHDCIPAGYSGRRHACTTFGLGLAVIFAGIVALDGVSAAEWVTVPLTLAYANLVEYLGHRGPMHHARPGLRLVFERHAGQHHRFFTDDLMAIDSARDLKAVLFPVVMILFFLLAFALPVWMLLAWLATSNVAWLFVISAVAYFLNYELLHLVYHLPERGQLATLPFVARLKRHHQRHHDPRLMSHYNFNITYPLCDWLFGTIWRGDRAVAGTPDALLDRRTKA